jgi:hypothetical protein
LTSLTVQIVQRALCSLQLRQISFPLHLRFQKKVKLPALEVAREII